MPEFHSVQLAYWLKQRNIDFALRQKKGTCIADDDAVYRALKDLEIKGKISILCQHLLYQNASDWRL
jgi:hypothetical protein